MLFLRDRFSHRCFALSKESWLLQNQCVSRSLGRVAATAYAVFFSGRLMLPNTAASCPVLMISPPRTLSCPLPQLSSLSISRVRRRNECAADWARGVLRKPDGANCKSPSQTSNLTSYARRIELTSKPSILCLVESTAISMWRCTGGKDDPFAAVKAHRSLRRHPRHAMA